MFDPEKPPALRVTRSFNTAGPLGLDTLEGKVVALYAFQMLCPGCVTHALPQAGRLRQRFSDGQLAIIGLHTVFEHHAVMTPEALEVFIREYGLRLPILVDEPDGKGPPKTMQAYEMRGTPTLLLFDRQGRLRRHYLGQVDDIRLAAELMALLIEAPKASRKASLAIEQALADALVDPEAHGHRHGHDHPHGHAHGDDCGCGPEHGPAEARG